jgi:hypothetical protein
MYTTSGTLQERLRSRTDQASWDRFVLIYTPLLYYCVRKFDLSEGQGKDRLLLLFPKAKKIRSDPE